MRGGELADELGVTNASIYNWETGKSFVSPRWMVAIAKIFGDNILAEYCDWYIETKNIK